MATTVGEVGLAGSPTGPLLDLSYLRGTYRDMRGGEG